MSHITNFWGGPGTGKSTSAAYVFSLLKQADQNAELVTEYVKTWAWEQRKIQEYDQVYFLGKQMRRESVLYGKANHIVTDSPILLSYYYAQKFASPGMAKGIEQIVQTFYTEAAEKGHKHTHVFLTRSKLYNPAGRFQTEDQAKQIDQELRQMLVNLGVSYIESGTQATELQKLMELVR